MAAVDVLIGVTSPDGRDAGRKLEITSRYADSPRELRARLTRNGPTAFEREAVGREGPFALAERLAEGRILGALSSEQGFTAVELAQMLGLPVRSINRDLQVLVNSGQAQRYGAGDRYHPYRYRLAPTELGSVALEEVSA